ncbi:MAG: ABC transporter ATP-binding protein [Calditrichia bacterium]
MDNNFRVGSSGAQLNSNLLSVHQLTLGIAGRKSRITLLEDISFSLKEGECLGVIGESGAGKSMLAHVLLGVQPADAQVASGFICFANKLLNPENPKDWQSIRGNEISMVFQNAAEALNPLITVGKQVQRVIATHGSMSDSMAHKRVLYLFEEMNLNNPEMVFNCFPHQLSGGMNQRVMLAMALCGSPRLVIADEPTSALDNESRDRVLSLLAAFKKKLGFALIFITHNIELAAGIADSLVVMKDGRIVEQGVSDVLLTAPTHHYTMQILDGQLP